MQDAGFRIQDSGYRIQDTGCRMKNVWFIEFVLFCILMISDQVRRVFPED
jgi:hypothetical protein